MTGLRPDLRPLGPLALSCGMLCAAPPPSAPKAAETPPFPLAPPIAIEPLADPTTNHDSDDAIRLPDFNVIEPRRLNLADHPREEELLTRYVGRARGLDRALLNRLVLRWETNLFVLTLDGAQDNRTRAKNRYADDLRLHQRAQLLDIAALVDRSGDTAAGMELKRESDRLFLRQARPR